MLDGPCQPAPLLLQALWCHASQHPERTAFEFQTFADDGEESLSFAELAEEAAFVAADLRRRGLDTRHRALLLYPAGLEFIVAFLWAACRRGSRRCPRR